MEYVKVSVTLEPKVAEDLRKVAGSRGQSAFVNEAVRRHLQAGQLRQLLDELDAEYGPVPIEVEREVGEIDWPD